MTPAALYQQSAVNDKTTIDYWRDIWLGNITANKQTYKSFADQSIGSEFDKYKYGPVIIAGSGPSLKQNAHEFKNRGKIPLVSCLHNFHFLEDLGAAPEYYVTLDAGAITIEEVTEGGTKPAEEYWEMTKDRTLCAFIGTHPELLKKWKGKILFYNCPIPEESLIEKIEAVEVFNCHVSTGGNVLGACLYLAKTVLGASQIIFTGADFAFGYNTKFHPWDSKYDAEKGHVIKAKDIYGLPVNTWPSYYNFKSYFDSVPFRVPGVYYNCSEGGCLGAYPTGNLACFQYMDLKDCLARFNINDQIKENIINPTLKQRKLLYS